MKIAVIGAGNVGQALAESWSKTGHQIFIGARDTNDTMVTTFAKQIGAEVLSLNTAVEKSDIVLLSVPWTAAKSLIIELQLGGKTIVDCTNPLKPDFSGLELGTTISGAETLQKLAPTAKIVKAFNTVGFNIMKNPILEGRKVVMPICGDDSSSMKLVKSLAIEVGFEPMEAGPLSSARLLEPFALMWIHSAMKFGMGRNFAFSIVRE